jgi:TonB family protein
MKALYTLLLILLGVTGYAQLYDTTYYDRQGTYVSKDKGVTYKIKSRIADRKGLYHLAWFFADGTLVSKGASLNSSGQPYFGMYASYYRNGKKQKEGEYQTLKWDEHSTTPTGKWNYWHESGAPAVEMEYVQDETTKTITERYLNAWDTAGTQTITNGNGQYQTNWCQYLPDTNCFELKGAVENGLPHGEWLCARNGTYISYKEQYDHGKFVKGLSYDTKGKKYVYSQHETPTEYVDGDSLMWVFIGANIKYPQLEKENDIQGKVVVGFIVNEDGSLSDHTLLRKVSPGIDAEAMRVAKLLPSFKPATKLGQPVKSQYNLPLVFKLQ